MTVSVTAAPFGTLADGQGASLYTLTNRHGLRVCVTNYGAITTSIMTPDRHGKLGEVTLGYDSLAPYLSDRIYLGASIGRYANRIGGAQFSLAAKRYELPANDGENHLHGGDGYHAQIWEVSDFKDRLTLNLTDREGANGYPGDITVVMTIILDDENMLSYSMTANSTAPTPINLTNHNYFNLAGGGDILDHDIQIRASAITPVDQSGIPTGEVSSVIGIEFDRRVLAPVRSKRGGVYDHNYCLDGWDGRLRAAAILSDPQSGRRMEMLTTQPGLQFYSGAHIPKGYPGRSANYGPHSGLCLEGQHYPDSPNQPQFPNTILMPGKPYQQTIAYRFSVMD